jgi:hypothetical protein
MKVFEGTDKEYYMDENLNNNLVLAKNVIKKDFDMISFCDGDEGSGKSTIVLQMAYFCDPTLDLSRVCFNADEFKAVVLKAKKFQAVIYDEAYTGLSARATMSRVNRALIEMLAEIRQRNLFIFVVAPTFMDADRYIALWRTRFLVHCYTSDNFDRGFFVFYNKDKKKYLYLHGKKLYQYQGHKYDFAGKFTKFMPIDEVAYREKKSKALRNRSSIGNLDDTKEKFDWLINRLIPMDLPVKLKAQIAGCSENCFFVHKRKLLASQKEVNDSELAIENDDLEVPVAITG